MSILISVEELLLATAQTPVTAAVVAVPESLSDHNLIAATRTGDEAAFAELVKRYRNPITNYIHRIINDYETSIDLAQETFVRIYQAADRYQTDYAFSTYIYRIATNLAISELRRRKRRRLVSLTSFFGGRGGSSGDAAAAVAERELDPMDQRPLQDATLVEEERRSAVTRAIQSLPEKYRVPLVLRDIEGHSYEQIAKTLQMSEGTIKSRISRARAFLRDKLQPYL